MTTFDPVHASGIVNTTTLYYGGGNSSGFNCAGMASVSAVQNCEIARRAKWLADDHDQYVRWGASNIASCPAPALNDLGPSGSYVDRFAITYYRIAYNCGGFGYYCNYITFCQQQSVSNFYIQAGPSTCPDHSSPTAASNPPTCTCDESYVPETSTSCRPEPLSIALYGLGVTVMPGATLSPPAYAKVTKGDGTPKSGEQVVLSYDVVPEENDGLPRSAHEATVSPVGGGYTDSFGRLNISFTAPCAGGTHLFATGCPDCANQETGRITVPGCPVPALTEPPFNDACATVLENTSSTQAQKDAACGALTDNLKTGMACFRDKLSNLSPAIPMVVTSDIRSVAYQAHLRQVWDRMERVVKWMVDNPTIQTACAARRAEIAAEKGCNNAGECISCYAESASQRSHCLVHRPANPSLSDAKHTEGKAFDVSRTRTLDPLQVMPDARTPPQAITQFLNAPTNCNLNWGGAFDDDVHFYVP